MLLLKGGSVVDGETGRVMLADVLIEDGIIKEVGKNLSAENAEILDCKNLIVTAGFVDTHVHVESSMVLPSAFGDAILPYGTVTVIADPHEIVNVGGAEGLRFFLEEAKKAPINVYTVLPSSVPSTPYDTNGAGKFLAKDMKEFVAREDVVGLGEVMSFFDVAKGEPEIIDKIELIKKYNKTVDGHTSGMPDEILDDYIGAGVQNDHECADKEGMLKRYERGMNIYVREGSAARNAYELLKCAKEKGLDCSRFAFCTDDKHLATIAYEGHISYVVSLALELGFSWGEIAKMVSYNPCRFYHLENQGNIRKGYRADIVVTNSSCQWFAYVIKDGKVAVRRNKLVKKSELEENREFENTVKFRNLTADDFALPESLQNVAIGLVNGQLLTNKLRLRPGEWKRSVRLATVERHGKNGNVAVCIIKGYGIRDGAIATSVSHDSHNVICAGDNPEDMALACNRLKELKGGYVIASRGKIVGELALPVYGLISDESAEKTSDAIQILETKAHELGVNRQIDAFTTLSFVALPVIPSVRLLDTGLFDVITSKFIR